LSPYLICRSRFRRTLVGLKHVVVRAGIGDVDGFRRTLVGLKDAEGVAVVDDFQCFRRTFVGLKRFHRPVRSGDRRVFQKDPRRVEARRRRCTSRITPRFRRTLVGLKPPALLETEPR